MNRGQRYILIVHDSDRDGRHVLVTNEVAIGSHIFGGAHNTRTRYRYIYDTSILFPVPYFQI